MLAREAEENSASLIYFASWSSTVTMEWAKYNIVGVNLRLNV
jgi:hypothetical protein